MNKDKKLTPSTLKSPQRRRWLRFGVVGAVMGVSAGLISTTASLGALAQTSLPQNEAAEANVVKVVAQNTAIRAAASYTSTNTTSTTSNVARKNWPLRAETLIETGAQAVTSLPTTAELSGLRFQQQTFNNCGPASLSMVLSYFGRSETQQDIAAVIKPYGDDKNVTAEELVTYAKSLGYNARIIEGADINLLKTFVANGLPVIAERWLDSGSDGEMGHFQVVMGYDQTHLEFFDSLQGENVKESMMSFDEGWQVFNRHFIAFWPVAKDATVKSILGMRWDETAMLQSALAVAQAEVKADASDKFAWFNIGTNQVKLGNDTAAVEAYDQATALNLPTRMLWYQYGIYEANLAVGNYEKVIQLTNETLVTGGLEENHYWRGLAYAALGNQTAARKDFTRALQFNENYQAAEVELERIESLSYAN